MFGFGKKKRKKQEEAAKAAALVEEAQALESANGGAESAESQDAVTVTASEVPSAEPEIVEPEAEGAKATDVLEAELETSSQALNSESVQFEETQDSEAQANASESQSGGLEPLAPATLVETPQEKPKTSWFARVKAGLSRTRTSFSDGLASLLLGKKAIDDDLLEEIETILLMADVGVEATSGIIESLTAQVSRKELADSDALYTALKTELAQLLKPVEQPLTFTGEGPQVILMVGVNGVGKTTTIGKLAKRYQGEGKSVMLAAGDTFRAAAVEQLQVWGERNKVPVIAQHTGADSASVLFDALQAAKSRGVDVLIADTAGRLQNKDNLMAELEKVVRVMKKLDPEAPHEVMLVLDAGTGQNALSQAKEFGKAVNVTGISLTKLDGTAKGGVIFALAQQAQLPIRFIGVGEQADDLRPFEAETFIDALFATESAE